MPETQLYGTCGSTSNVNFKGGWLNRVQQMEYENINQMIMAACLQAEKQYHRFKAGWIPWNPSLMKATKRVLYGKGCYKNPGVIKLGCQFSSIGQKREDCLMISTQ